MINDIAFKWAAIKAERPIMGRQNELWTFDNMTTSTDIDKSVNDLYDYELVKFRFLATKLKTNQRSELNLKSKCFLTKMWIRRRVSVNDLGKAQ